MKRLLVGTSLGALAMRGREFWRTLNCPPEQAGRLAQEAVAAILLPRLCRGTFVDVGAHIGSVIAAVRSADPKLPIVGIEADPKKAWQLTQRWPDVTIHSCAVGDCEKNVSFYVNHARPGFSSLNNAAPSETSKVTVPMRQLDDLVSEADLIKIDVEGAELGVLRGAVALVDRCRPTVYFESGIGEPEACDELFDWFDSRQYGIYVPNRVAHDGPPLTREGFSEGHYYPVRTNNYFAIAVERRVDIRDQARKILGIATG